MVSDMSFIESRSEDTRKYTIILFVVLGFVTSLVTVIGGAPVVARLDRRCARALLRGEGVLRPFSVSDSDGKPARRPPRPPPMPHCSIPSYGR